MKKEWADKWVAALRSGEYGQTARHLRDNSGFCCLGVLCDIALGREAWTCADRSFGLFALPDPLIDVGTFRTGALPLHVMNLTGMRNDLGEFALRDIAVAARPSYNHLSQLNDCAGWDFKRIADFIETNWEAL